jgi:succinate dehydrogenase flavin-adding protein (antitoxin of CptAB toxin-antitoxin module)
MLELDAWLQAFLDEVYPGLDSSQRQAFSRLLDREDVEILTWLAGREAPPADLGPVVGRIRTCRVRAK